MREYRDTAQREIQGKYLESELLERMSHEIRTPMNSIIGLAYLSRENIGNEKQVLENLDKIEQSAQFLRNFIDDILNLSRLRGGRVANNETETPFAPFLEELEGEIAQYAKEKQVAFEVHNRGEISGSYLFDKEKLKEALYGILDNAVKFTGKGGKVDFIVELLAQTPMDATFRFEVHDTGMGMEKQFLPHMFDPFEQESESGATLYGGTGLGLTVSKNIIEFMGGRIDGYSEKGKGSTFIVMVTLNKVPDNAGGRKRQRMEYDFSGRRLLLVEDNEINIEITRNILVHKNFDVDVAVDGEKGLAQFLEHPAGYYDAILMDIRMPVMDGLTAARRIRESAHPDSKDIPIIAMTANVFEEDVKKSLAAGMNAHLRKPVDVQQMYAVLDGAMTEL